MDLVPESINGVTVFNLLQTKSCPKGCSDCGDFAVSIHNILLNSDFRYLIFDLQDEKEVCEKFLEETLHLWRRLRFPFLFAGVMPKPEKILMSYAYHDSYPVFDTANDAVEMMKEKFPQLLKATYEGVEFGKPIPINKSKNQDDEAGED